MLLTVFDPATAAPMPPIKGEKIGHAEPTSAATPVGQRDRHALVTGGPAVAVDKDLHHGNGEDQRYRCGCGHLER